MSIQNTLFAHILPFEWDASDISKDLLFVSESLCHLLATLDQDACAGTLHTLKLSIQSVAVYQPFSLLLFGFQRHLELISKVISGIHTTSSEIVRVDICLSTNGQLSTHFHFWNNKRNIRSCKDAGLRNIQ